MGRDESKRIGQHAANCRRSRLRFKLLTIQSVFGWRTLRYTRNVECPDGRLLHQRIHARGQKQKVRDIKTMSIIRRMP